MNTNGTKPPVRFKCEFDDQSNAAKLIASAIAQTTQQKAIIEIHCPTDHRGQLLFDIIVELTEINTKTSPPRQFCPERQRRLILDAVRMVASSNASILIAANK